MFYADEHDSFHLESSWWLERGGTDCREEMSTRDNMTELPSYTFQAPIDGSTEPQAMEMDGSPIVELNNDVQMSARGRLTLNVAHPLMRPSSSTAVVPDVQAIPQLSPQGTPVKDSPVSSLTPKTIQSAITPPQSANVAFHDSVSPDGIVVSQKLHFENQLAWFQEVQAMQVLSNPGDISSTVPYPDDVATMPAYGWHHHAEVQYQDSNTTHALQEYAPPVQQAPLQRASTMPSRLSDERRQRLGELGPLLGTFELDHATSTFVRHPDDWKSSELHAACAVPSNGVGKPSSIPHDVAVQSIPQSRQNQWGGNRQTSATNPTSTPKTIHEPIKCGFCSKDFVGKYGPGNLRRHLKHLHPTTPSTGNDLTCHRCKKTYKRSDALRSHRWRKHALPEAKPKPKSTS